MSLVKEGENAMRAIAGVTGIVGWAYRNDVSTIDVSGAQTPDPFKWTGDLDIANPNAWSRLNELGRQILRPYFEQIREGQEPVTPPTKTEMLQETAMVA